MPLPSTATAHGRLVSGFPTSIVPVVQGTRVVSSSVSSEDKTLQLSLSLRTTRGIEKSLTSYRMILQSNGFGESRIPAVGGSRAAAFTHGIDSVVFTARSLPAHQTSISIIGTLHAGPTR